MSYIYIYIYIYIGTYVKSKINIKQIFICWFNFFFDVRYIFMNVITPFRFNNICMVLRTVTRINMADKFEQLEQQLELFIENARQMGIIVSDFQPQGGQSVLNQKLWVIIGNLALYFNQNKSRSSILD